MSNAANSLNLSQIFFTGSNGGLSTSGGSIVVSASSKQFPLSNAVYVDKNASSLFAQGILAYDNIADAIASWRSGGAAQLAYGTPTATNRGAVIVGMGVFTISGTVTWDVPYIDIIGATNNPVLHEISGSIGGPLLDITVDNVRLYSVRIANLSDFTIGINGSLSNNVYENLEMSSSSGNVFGFFKVYSGALNGTYRKIRFGWNQEAFNLDSCSAISSPIFEDCFAEGNNGGAQDIFIQMGSSPNAFNPILRRFVLTGGGQDAFYTGGNSDAPFGGAIYDSSFSMDGQGATWSRSASNVTVSLFNVQISADNTDGQTSELKGRMENCYFVTTASNSFAIKLGSGSILRKCIAIGNGTGLAVEASSAINAEISSCVLRLPTGGALGSSVSANITNTVSTPLNVELPSTTTS